MASLANVQDAINHEHSQPRPEQRDEEPASGRPPIATTTNAPELDRTASVSAHPPGAWVDDGHFHNDDGAGEMSLAALSDSIVGALGSAAKYLPAGVVNTFTGYAPGVAGPSKSATGSTTDVSKAGTAIDATPSGPAGPVASKDQFVFKSSQEDLTAGVAGMNLSKDSQWKAPTPAAPAASMDSLPPMSINKDSGSEVPSRSSSVVPASDAAGVATAAQFVDLDVLTPLSPASIRNATNVGGGRPSATVSTTAVTGHSSGRSGIEAPPPSAATLLSPGPPSSKLPSTLNITPTKENDVPSSVVSVKSGVVAAGPTDELASASASTSTSTTNPYSANTNKVLPPTPAGGMVQDGVTPRQSELEDDLQYLAPHIRQQSSTAGAAQPAEPALGGSASRFDEGELESAHPTPASEVGSHSRESSVSEGGSRRVSIVKRIRGEAKIIAGKIKKDEGKVAEGKAMLQGEV